MVEEGGTKKELILYLKLFFLFQDRPRRVFFGTLTQELYSIESSLLQNSTIESEDLSDLVQVGLEQKFKILGS